MESILMSCEKISIKVVEKLIIQNISLAVNKNQIVGLLGPNGAGKTSTFYAIAGIVKIDSGKILFQENEIHNLPIHKRANHGLAYLPQEPSLFSDLSVIENLNGISELSKQPNLMTVDEIIHTFNLKKIINKKGSRKTSRCYRSRSCRRREDLPSSIACRTVWISSMECCTFESQITHLSF